MEIQFSITLSTNEATIDLVDLGYDESTCWEDLSEDEQFEITDSIRNETIVYVHKE